MTELFISVLVLSCNFWSDIPLKCYQSYETNIRTESIESFGKLDFRECKKEDFDNCEKRVTTGCLLTLKNDKIYYSKLACPNL